MFDSHDSIHVLYGANDVAVWTIIAALLTFASSLVLGIAALRNGSKATRFAKESADRDSVQRKILADLQLEEHARQARVRRFEFTVALRNFFDLTLTSQESSKDRQSEYREIERLGARTDERSSGALRDYVFQRASYAREPFKGLNLHMPALRDCYDLISSWESDPKSVEVDPTAAWDDHMKMIENLIQVIKDEKARTAALFAELHPETGDKR